MSDTKHELEEIHRSLAGIDAGLLQEIEKRARLSKRAGELRARESGQLPPLETLLEAVVSKASGDFPVESLRVAFREIIGACLTLELPIKIAVLGPEGSAATVAARHRFGAGASLVVEETPAAVLAEVAGRRAEYAVLPLEGKIEGPVQSTIEALMESDLRIASVEETAATLHLMNKRGDVADIQQIAATLADQSRAERFLAAHPSKVALLDVKSPLLACELAVAEPATAALVIEEFGRAMGLEIARRNPLAEEARYAVIGGRPSSRTGRDITAFAFSVQDTPGALLGVLRQFSERGINMLTLQSHPAPGDGWNYVFFVELDGHATDRALVTAFEEVKRVSRFFKVLGSYPAE
jgi:chorismate mutase/prephenate dehydratase